MNNTELVHWGVKGMRWGVRRYQNPDGSLTAEGRKHYSESGGTKSTAKTSTKSSSSTSGKKTVKELSDDELKARIGRLELEKRYSDLSKTDAKTSKGKAFVMDVIEKSGKNIATQLTTYAMGTAVNKALKNVFNDDAIVNPKKGQKDK